MSVQDPIDELSEARADRQHQRQLLGIRLLASAPQKAADHARWLQQQSLANRALAYDAFIEAMVHHAVGPCPRRLPGDTAAVAVVRDQWLLAAMTTADGRRVLASAREAQAQLIKATKQFLADLGVNPVRVQGRLPVDPPVKP